MTRFAHRAFVVSLLLVHLLAAGHAAADASSAIGAGIAAGATAGAVASLPGPTWRPQTSAVMGRELPEWVDRLTGSASRMASSCGQTLEARLSGMPRRNFLDLMVSNDTDEPADLAQQVTVHFGSGLTRQLISLSDGDTQIKPHWLVHRVFAFPSKEEFEHEARLSIALTISNAKGEACIATVAFEHRPGAYVPERSYTAFSPIELAFGLPVHFVATGGLRTIAERVNPGFDIGFSAYPWVHHGFTFEFGVDAYGRQGLSAVLPNQDSNAITGAFFMLGYSYRIVPFKALALEYNFNLGPYVFEVESTDQKNVLASSAALGVREKLKLNFLLWTTDDQDRIELGPAFIHSYLPAGDFGAAHISGNLFSAALYLTLD